MASGGGLNLIDTVTAIYALPGDLPDGWAWRPDTNGATGMRTGERSVYALTRQATTPAVLDTLKIIAKTDPSIKIGKAKAAAPR